MFKKLRILLKRDPKESEEFISEDFFRMIRVLSADMKLREWCLSLQDHPDNLRISELGALVEKMKAQKQSPELIANVEALMSPDIFRAATKVIQDLKPNDG